MLRGILNPGDYAGCPCRKCWFAYCEANDIGLMERGAFIVCVTCGNKRCPHATDHALPCTNSNEPGQKGSVYE